MSDSNRHWMGSSKRVSKLVNKNADTAKQREYFKRQKEKEKELKAKKAASCEDKKEPPKKKVDVGVSMNMLALCADFDPLPVVSQKV